MKKYIILLTISLLAFNIKAQNQNLTVSSLSGQNVESILQQYLAGEGVLITGCNCPGVFDNPAKFNNQAGNITYPQIGSFNRNGFTSFPFTSGLVMTTGNVSIAAGPNNSSSASSAVSPSYTETALSSYTTNNVTSSASLEFDFIAMTDEFSFNFIFGSEEYCEYVNSSFNDVFAFLLTGVDPVTYAITTKNVAIGNKLTLAAEPLKTPTAAPKTADAKAAAPNAKGNKADPKGAKADPKAAAKAKAIAAAKKKMAQQKKK